MCVCVCVFSLTQCIILNATVLRNDSFVNEKGRQTTVAILAEQPEW